MTNTRTSRVEAVRIAVVLTALLFTHLGCSFESLGHLGNGKRQDAQNADARELDMGGRAEVAMVADAPLPGSGGRGGDASAGDADASDTESASAAGGAAGFGGGRGDATGNGGWTEIDGGSVIDRGGVSGVDAAAGSGGWTGSGGASATDTGVDAAAGSGGWTGSGGASATDTGGSSGIDAAAGSGGWTGSGGASATDSGGVSGTGGAAGGGQTGGSAAGGSLAEVDAGGDAPQSVDSGIVDAPATVKSVLFVVRSEPLIGGDAVLQAHLQLRGFEVTVVRDLDLPATPQVDARLVLISRGTWSLLIGTKFRTTPVPVLVCEPSLYVDMAMVDRTLGSWGTTSATSLVVDPSAGPLAAGLSGASTMVTAATEDMNYGVPSEQAILVATFLNKPTLWSVFAYDTAAPMFGLDAPARRGGFFFSKTAPSSLTTEGWQLFDAMVDWLVQ